MKQILSKTMMQITKNNAGNYFVLLKFLKSPDFPSHFTNIAGYINPLI